MGSKEQVFCPENFILLGIASAWESDVNMIVSNTKAYHPELFEGNIDSFTFELRYAVPFDKDFRELKRLQGTASEAAGRRSEFKGFIILDMNSWLTHHEEEYLQKALLFLVDMSDWWKYIFIIDDGNPKAARELAGQILSVFLSERILCRIRERTEEYSGDRVSSLCRAQGVVCTSQAKEFFRYVLDQGFDESVITALLGETQAVGKRVSMDMIAGFTDDHASAVRYLLTQKEFHRLEEIFEKRKEEYRYGGKESV